MLKSNDLFCSFLSLPLTTLNLHHIHPRSLRTSESLCGVIASISDRGCIEDGGDCQVFRMWIFYESTVGCAQKRQGDNTTMMTDEDGIGVKQWRTVCNGT